MDELFENKIKKLYNNISESTVIDDDDSVLINKNKSAVDIANDEYQIESAKNSILAAWQYLYNEKKPRGFKLVNSELFDNIMLFQQIDNASIPGKYVSDIINQIFLNDAWKKNITIESKRLYYKISLMTESIIKYKEANNINLKDSMLDAIENYITHFIKSPNTLSLEDTRKLYNDILDNQFIYDFINNSNNEIKAITHFAMTKDEGLAMIRYHKYTSLYEYITVIVPTGKVNYYKYLEENKKDNSILSIDIKGIFKKYKIGYLYMNNFKPLTLDTDFIKKDGDFLLNNTYNDFGDEYKNIMLDSFKQSEKYLRYYALFPYTRVKGGEKNAGKPIIPWDLYAYYAKVKSLAKKANWADKDNKGWSKADSSMDLILMNTRPTICYKCKQEDYYILYLIYYPSMADVKRIFPGLEYNDILKNILPLYNGYITDLDCIGILTVEIINK